jgi:hypothetical protein
MVTGKPTPNRFSWGATRETTPMATFTNSSMPMKGRASDRRQREGLGAELQR